MSSDFQENSSAPSPSQEEKAGCSVSRNNPTPSGREWIISALLFLATFATTTFAGLVYFVGIPGIFYLHRILPSNPELILFSAVQYSVPLMTILLAHEMGHFLACRYYGIRCTLPFFIPVPLPVFGTFGAFIKIKSPFVNRRSLFDVGIAGPLAGYFFTLFFLYIGIGLSQIDIKRPFEAGFLFGEPLVFRTIAHLLLDFDPSIHDLQVHPTVIAGLFGLLVTSLNLLPVWQLDGGHIFYAVFGPGPQKKISIIVLVLLMLVGLSGWPTPSYVLFGLVLFVIGLRTRFHHPPTLREWEKVGTGRILLAILSMIILIISFTSTPISLVGQ